MSCGLLSPQGSYAMEVEGEQVHQVRAAGRCITGREPRTGAEPRTSEVLLC